MVEYITSFFEWSIGFTFFSFFFVCTPFFIYITREWIKLVWIIIRFWKGLEIWDKMFGPGFSIFPENFRKNSKYTFSFFGYNSRTNWAGMDYYTFLERSRDLWQNVGTRIFNFYRKFSGKLDICDKILRQNFETDAPKKMKSCTTGVAAYFGMFWYTNLIYTEKFRLEIKPKLV